MPHYRGCNTGRIWSDCPFDLPTRHTTEVEYLLENRRLCNYLYVHESVLQPLDQRCGGGGSRPSCQSLLTAEWNFLNRENPSSPAEPQRSAGELPATHGLHFEIVFMDGRDRLPPEQVRRSRINGLIAIASHTRPLGLPQRSAHWPATHWHRLAFSRRFNL